VRALVLWSLVPVLLVVGFVLLRAAQPAPAPPRAPNRSTVATTTAADADVNERTLADALRALKTSYSVRGAARGEALKEATAKLEVLAYATPKDPRVPFFRGIVAILAHDENAARDQLGLLGTISTVGRTDLRYLYLSAVVLIEFEPKKTKQAIGLLRTLRSEAPEFEPELVDRALWSALMRAAASSNVADADAAIAHARDAVALARNDPERLLFARHSLAELYERAQRLPESEELWRMLVRETQGAPVPLYGLASILAIQARYEEAAAEFTKVLAFVDEAPVTFHSLREARMRRANCYRLLGRSEDARADLEKYVQQHPDDHRGLYWFAILRLDHFDDPAGARPLLEKAYQMAPYCEPYQRSLVALYDARLAEPAKAEALRAEIESRKAEFEAIRRRLEREPNEGSYVCQ
jgi:tetratricopeptide (TPR) repeat protein